MTDEEAAATVRAEADALEQHAEELVQAGELEPEQAQVIREQAATAREATQRKGFKKKLVGAFGKIRRGLAKGSRVVIRGAGYGSQAAAIGFWAPIWMGGGFAAGVVAGETTPDIRPVKALVVATSLGSATVSEITALSYANNVPVLTSGVFPITTAVAAINTLIICSDEGTGDEDGSKYCQNIGKINRAMTTGAYKASRKGGSKVRRFFGKIFRGRRGDPQPQPAPVAG
ncbi:MAG TPA: hypothetical protein VM598_03095 [Bdellovibrionota bacterium]|nr:hypothetical protein [Bdellovibrionota bacterium]